MLAVYFCGEIVLLKVYFSYGIVMLPVYGLIGMTVGSVGLISPVDNLLESIWPNNPSPKRIPRTAAKSPISAIKIQHGGTHDVFLSF